MPTNEFEQNELRRRLMEKLRRQREIADDTPEAKPLRGEPLDLLDKFQLKVRRLDQKIRREARRRLPGAREGERGLDNEG